MKNNLSDVNLSIGDILTLEFEYSDSRLEFLSLPIFKIRILDKSGLLYAISKVSDTNYNTVELDKFGRHLTMFELQELIDYQINLPNKSLFSFTGIKVN